MAPVQDLPPPCAATLILRRDQMLPPPHVTLQVFLDHSPYSQSTFGRPSHPKGATSPGAGLHDSSSCNAPSQGLPCPRPILTICLERLVVPLQVAEQALHKLHWLSRQSRSASQGTVDLQFRYSRSEPINGFPQLFGTIAAVRVRQERPPAQDVEQAPQANQSDHFPSIAMHVSHDFSLHGLTSSSGDG